VPDYNATVEVIAATATLGQPESRLEQTA
jgi:hypothetical protein